MHILATETEEQAVYFGQLILPSYSILPPSHKKLKKSFCLKSCVQEMRMCWPTLVAFVIAYTKPVLSQRKLCLPHRGVREKTQ